MTYSTGSSNQTFTVSPWIGRATQHTSDTASMPVPFIPDDHGHREDSAGEPEHTNRLLRGGITQQTTVSGVRLDTTQAVSDSEISVATVVSALVTSARSDDSLIVASLEETAQRDDQRMFIEQAEAIDWSARHPDELTRAIDLALSQDLVTLATDLAQQGGRLFPHDNHIQRAAGVLGTPAIRISQSPPITGLKASREWLRNHGDQYRGRWVAVYDGQLVGVAETAKELITILGPKYDRSNTIITEIV